MLKIDGGKFTYGFFKFIDALAQVGNRPSWNKNIGVKMSASVVLEWRNLNLTFEKREFEFSKFNTTVEEKRILDNVSGSLKSGQLVAILGPSGAGKTTLLAGISQRFRGPLTGKILVNGTEIDRKTMTNISCFVPQFDATIDTLTPNEHLYFMAELKLDRKWSRSRKNQRIDTMLHELGLQHVANNRISTLSGGERKKLDLATDLLTNPPIIFCDEPTTGLDSFNARKVIEALKYLSHTNNDDENSSLSTVDNNGFGNEYDMELFSTTEAAIQRPAKAVICSIHQPTSDIFQCFTHIILMYAGRCVFYGTRDEAINHFSKLGFECPASYNPADFYMKVLSTASLDDESAHQTFFKRPIELIRQSSAYEPPDVKHVASFNVKDYKIRSPLWIGQVWLLIQRSMLSIRRSWKEILLDLALFAIPYIVMAFLYLHCTGRTQETVRDVLGAFLLMSCGVVFTQAYSVMNFYQDALPVLRRETNEHIYKFSAYYVAEIVNALPVCFLRAFTGLAIVYFAAGFNIGFLVFLELLVTFLIAAFTANAYGLMMSNIFKIAISDVASITDLIFLVISGFYINLKSFPFIRYISFFFFTNEATAIIFFSNIDQIECSPKLNGNCFGTGSEVLESLSYHTQLVDVLFDFVGLFTLGLIFHVTAYLFTRRNIRSVGYY